MSSQYDGFGVDLGVGIDVVTDTDGVGLVDTVGEVETVGGHRGEVHEPPCAGVDRGPQDATGTQNVDVPGLLESECCPAGPRWNYGVDACQ